MKVITIDRVYAACGHTIGKMVAEELGIELYDYDITTAAAKAGGISRENVASEEESLSKREAFVNALVPISYDEKDEVFRQEQEAIIEFARKGPCVIVGRCALVTLEEAGIDALNVFLYAQRDARVEEAGKLLGLTERNDILNAIKKKDHKRRAYFEYYGGHRWGDPADFDLMLNVGHLGKQFCADAICAAARLS